MRKETHINIAKIVLGLVAVGGLLTVAAVAPNALKAVDLFYDKKKKKYNTFQKRYYVKKVIERMESKGLIEFYERNGGVFLRLSERGRKELLKYQLKDKTISTPRKWDKKWRMVIFDIEERSRTLRDGLRKELMGLGFVKVQNSVWVHPYECEEVVALLKTYFEIEGSVIFATVDRMENDGWLKEEFQLS